MNIKIVNKLGLWISALAVSIVGVTLGMLLIVFEIEGIVTEEYQVILAVTAIASAMVFTHYKVEYEVIFTLMELMDDEA